MGVNGIRNLKILSMKTITKPNIFLKCKEIAEYDQIEVENETNYSKIWIILCSGN